MGHLPIIANVFRVTFLWSPFAGITVRNVIHVQEPGGTLNESQIGTAIGNELGTVTGIFKCVPTGFVLQNLQVLELDGVSAGVTVAFSATGGGSSSETIPQASAIMKLHTGLRGPAKRGRLFIGPVGEAAQSAGILDGTVQTTMATAWATVRTNLTAHSPTIKWGVASYKLGTFTALDADPVIETKLGTQRRRMQQLRRFG